MAQISGEIQPGAICNMGWRGVACSTRQVGQNLRRSAHQNTWMVAVGHIQETLCLSGDLAYITKPQAKPQSSGTE